MQQKTHTKALEKYLLYQSSAVRFKSSGSAGETNLGGGGEQGVPLGVKPTLATPAVVCILNDPNRKSEETE